MSFQFNESYYLTNNADVFLAVATGQIASGLAHYNQFGWADRQAGTVNLPISRAMDEVVAYYNEPGRAGHEKWRGPLKYVSSEGAATGVAMAEQTPDD